MPKAAATEPKPKAAPPTRKPRASRAKKVDPEPVEDAASSDVDVEPPGKPQRQLVNWAKNRQWTDSLVTYLSDNPDFRRKLFSDSTAEAKKEQRLKLVAKDGKSAQYAVLAKFIFEEDPKEQARYLNDPSKYATSVETRIRRLKKEYKVHIEVLGATGAGLQPGDVEPGSNVASLIDRIVASWPWWTELHSFWRELPSYNPIGVQSSQPGTDHASAAADLFEQTAASSEADRDATPEDEGEDDGRSATSMAQHDDDKAYSVSAGSEDEGEVIEIKSSRSSTPLVPLPVAKKIAQLKGKTKAVSGRDLGLAKGNAAKSSSQVAKKKPKNPVERLNDIREAEASQLVEKRQLQHDVEMERMKIKRMKIELKLAQVENDLIRLNRHATSQSPRQRNRVLHIGSPSLSRSRPSRYSRYSAASPRHVEFNHIPSGRTFDTFEDVAGGSSGGGSSGSFAFGLDNMPDFSLMDYNSVASTSSVDQWGGHSHGTDSS
ncbi:hypothetical protein B0H19DRAFT_1074377 [Mycena capillaripes]|nr:hypothetical protein B0H19DRAFT_1074377 [Mycena capillaripes]